MTPSERAAETGEGREILQFGDYVLDLRSRALYLGPERVHLTLTPTEVLIALALKAGRLVTKEDLIRQVWKDTAVTDDSVVQAVKEIRRALGEKSGEDRYIQTVHRQGYRFVAAVNASRTGATAAGGAARSGDAPEARRQADAARVWAQVTTVGPDSSAAAVPQLAGSGRGPGRLRPSLALAFATALAVFVSLALWFALPRSWLLGREPSQDPSSPLGVLVRQAAADATIHAAGVVLEIDGDANRNATASLEWRPRGSAAFLPAHPLVRIDATRMVGSLFWLDPATAYEARVTLSDPDRVSGGRTTLLTMQTAPETPPRPTLNVLFVSPDGRDANSGASPGQALRSIQRAADLARPGDVVEIAPGVYRESVRVRSSGTRIQPIVFRGTAPGVVLDGADERIAAGVPWIAAGDDVFRTDAGFVTTHVTTERGRLFRYESLDDLRALRAGPPGGFVSRDAQLYVKLSDHSSPAAHAIHAGRLNHALVLDGRSFVDVENLEVRHYGGREPGIGILMRDCTGCAVRGCRIHEVGRAGVWVEGGQAGRIEDNEVRDTSIAAWPWHEVNLSAADNHAIFFWGPAPRGFVIRRNRVHGTFDGIAPCGSGPPEVGLTTETDVYENLIADVADDGIEAEPYCSNLRIWGNRIERAHMAVSVAPVAPGPTWLVRNIAFRFGAARAREVWLASALKINTGEPIDTGPLLVYHNTFVTDVPGVDGVALLEPGKVASIVSRNNVIAATRRALYKVNRLPWDGDGDLLFSTTPDQLVEWHGADFATLEAFRRATGQEARGLSVAPALIDPGRGRFEPAPGSPLLDRGLILPGINDRFAGRAPDIGAIEARR